ncbi:MAG: hypothetical protein LBO78_04180 [Rickettsiales bacterium]|jgi:hypothetical protein|nr:hypothetical protein [Rickettsiales bacterium]
MRTLRFLTLALALASCGFRPMYEKNLYNDLDVETSRIAIAPVSGYDGVTGVNLRNSLLGKLTPHGKPENPKYTLSIKMNEPSIQDYTIKNDGTASSYLVTINASYSLAANSDRRILLSKSSSASMSYNILKDQYSTEMLKSNTIKLVVESISEDIYMHIISFFTER